MPRPSLCPADWQHLRLKRPCWGHGAEVPLPPPSVLLGSGASSFFPGQVGVTCCPVAPLRAWQEGTQPQRQGQNSRPSAAWHQVWGSSPVNEGTPLPCSKAWQQIPGWGWGGDPHLAHEEVGPREQNQDVAQQQCGVPKRQEVLLGETLRLGLGPLPAAPR